MPEPAFTTWKSRPLFVSSTFADMHAERDHLRVHAFDVLREQLLERCHYLETIDLRQGVETAQQGDEGERELKVLKVCLDEIERSRPFFVGILGDRYGWTPPSERMEAAAQAAGFEAGVVGKSVTELEILYGVLENPDQRGRSWFYFRELDYTGMPAAVRKRFDDRLAEDPEAAERVSKLEALKKRITHELPDRVRTYRARWDPAQGQVVDLEDLAGQVKADLWQDLDRETREWLRDAPRTWLEADRRGLDDFVEGRLRGFVEREAVTDPLIEHALSSVTEGCTWGVCVTGEAGSGKSSVFGRIYRALQQKQAAGDDVFVLAHAAGIYQRSGSVDFLLRRWIHELASFLEIEDPLAAEESGDEATRPRISESGLEPTLSETGPEEVERTFASLLTRAAQRTRVVVLIDALNQFERSTRARYLTWLPRLWPDNARFLATAIPGTEAVALADRPGAEVQPVPAMTTAEARQVAEHFYRQRFHRQPNVRALEVLLGKTLADGRLACGNPLWLELALQEMNLLEADDYARAEREFPDLPGAERIEALQVREAEALPADPAGMYGELLDRAGRDHGKGWTDALLSVIALARTGWRESDLRVLVPEVSGEPWDELTFAGVRRTLGAHLVQRGAQAEWDAIHAQLRECVLVRNLPNAGERGRLHGLIADHLDALPEEDPLRISETMVHLIGLGDSTRAARYLARFWFGDSALAAAATVLAQHAAAEAEGMAFLAGLPEAEGLADHDIWRCASNLLFECREALDRVAGLTPQLVLLEVCRSALERLGQSDPSNAVWQRDLSVSHNRVGDVLRAQGNLVEALDAYRESMAVAECLAQSDPSNAVWQNDLSVSHNRIGDVLRAQGNLVEALDAYRESMAVAECLAQSDPSNAVWLRDLSVSYCYVGMVLQEQGNLDEALIAYRHSNVAMKRLAQSDPSNAGWQRDLSVSHEKLGDVLLAQGNLGEALDAYRESMAIRERLAQNDRSNAGWQRDLVFSHYKLAGVAEQANEEDVRLKHLHACRRVMLGMRDAGMYLDPQLQQLLEWLESLP